MYLDLLLLASLERGPLHGYAVIEWLRRRSRGEVVLAAGTLYPALHRLESERLIRGEWEEAAGQRKRRVYRLTTKGERALARRQQEWLAFSRVMRAVVGGANG